MVPLDTPIGADLVCVDVTPRFHTKAMPLVLGAVYRLRGWCPTFVDNDMAVLVDEVNVRDPQNLLDTGFYRDRFRVLNLPNELTSLLADDFVPVRENA